MLSLLTHAVSFTQLVVYSSDSSFPIPSYSVSLIRVAKALLFVVIKQGISSLGYI